MAKVSLNTTQSFPAEEDDLDNENILTFPSEAEQPPEVCIRRDPDNDDDQLEVVCKSSSETEYSPGAENGNVVSAESNSPFRFREGGWGWVCVASYFVMNILAGSIVNVFSLISVELRIRYDISTQVAGWVYSVNMVLYMLSGPLCTALCRRYSCRRVAIVCAVTLSIGVLSLAYSPNIYVVFLGYSVLGGISNGMHGLVSVLIIGQYFNKRRGKATGIVQSGKSIGQMIYAPLFSFLFVHYGYKGAILLITGLTLHLFVGGALLRSPRKKLESNRHLTADPVMQEELVVESAISVPKSPNVNKEKQCEKFNIISTETTTDGSTVADGSPLRRQWLTTKTTRMLEKINALIDLSLLKDPVFLVYGGLLFGVNSMSNSFYNASLAGIIKDKNFSRNQVALLMSLAGGIGFLTKLAGGFMNDLKILRPHRAHLSMVFYLVPVLTLLLIPIIEDTGWLFALWLLFAMGASFFGSQNSVIMVDVVGIKRHASAVGLSMPFRGLGILLGPPIGGYLRDLTDSYSTSLYVIGALNLIAIFVVEVVFLCNKRKLDRILKENFAK